jgi:hypothetical protein
MSTTANAAVASGTAARKKRCIRGSQFAEYLTEK